MTTTDHRPYFSLEQFRVALISKYLEIYTSDVVVQEKIHGSNISIVGTTRKAYEPVWNIQLGSRKRWIGANEKFNNFQQLVNKHKKQIINLFNLAIERNPEFIESIEDGEIISIRIYGEIYGGKYGGTSANDAIRTQKEPNYCPFNDFAFFDMIICSNPVPVLDTHTLVQEVGLKIAPIIYQGQLSKFLENFDVNKFNSIVSHTFYGLPFIEVDNSTEGVTIRTTNPHAEGDECTILKFKQTWAVENPRVFQRKIISLADASEEQLSACMAMLNENRLISYSSKNTIEDMTNPKLLVKHVKEIIEDTMKDIIEEFPVSKYPELNHKNVRSKLSKNAFPMIKGFISKLTLTLSDEERIANLARLNEKLLVEAKMITQRIEMLNTRLNKILA